MDPDACLDALREAFSAENHDTARELFEALDRWLKRGGFAPRDWVVAR